MVAPIKPIGPIKPVLAPAGQSTAPATDPNAKPPVAGQPAVNGEPAGQQTAQPKPGEKVFNITTDKDPTGEFTKVFASDEQHAQQVYRQQGTAAGQFKSAELAQESIDTMVSMLAKNGIEEGRDYYVNGTIYTDNQVMAEDITDIINMQDWDKKRAVSRKHDDSNEYYVDLEAPKSKMPGKGNISKFKKSLNICREVLSSETATSEQKAQAKTVMDSIKTQLGTIIADSEPVSESTNTMTGKVHFNIDSERAYQHVMDKFGQSIEWAGDTMVADRKIWPAIEELALAAGGAAEEEFGTQGPDVEEAAPVKATAPVIDEAKGDTIEAYGARGMKNTPWRKSFKNIDALNKWAEANDAEVMGTRDLEQAKRGNLSPAVDVDEAQNDYFKRRKDEEDRIAGTKAPAKRKPKQTDYEKKRKEQAVDEGVAETLPMADAVKVLRHYGADNFKTTSNELHFYKQGRPFSVDLVLNSDATRSVTLSSLNSATRGLKGQGLPNKQVKEGQLNEYLVREGMPVKDVLVLNLFQDFDPAEGCAAHFPEFAQEPMWKQVVRKYAPIAKMLEKKLLAQKRPLTAAEAEAVEETWYDGSDAYDDMEIEYLVNIYDQQIDTLEALLAGNLTDEEFDEGVAEGEVAEAKHGLNKRVRIVSGPADCIGKIGTVGEVRPGLHKGAEKTYTVDYDYDGNTGRSKSVQLKAKDLRLVKDDITESIMDKKSTMTEGEKVKTKTGMIHKGTYGSEVDVNDDGSKKKKAAPKSATGKRGRPAKAAEPKTSKSNDPFGRVPDKAPKGKKGTVVKGKATKDDNLEEARETLKTAKGTIYKGGTYGTSYDVGDNVKKAPAKKSPTGQRGRPKKEVSYDDSVAKGAKDLQGMFGSKAPKKGSALDKLPKTKHKIKDSNVEEGLAHIRGLKQQITETIRQVQRLPIEKQNDQRVIDIVSRLEETVSKAVGNVLRESHETMAHIISRFPAEVKQFAAGGDLDDGHLYDALYDYYSLHGEMPYGVAKARTGDPYEWVTNRFAQDIGDHYETESVMDEASGAHMFMTGEIVYFDNRRGKVDRQEGNKVFVHTGNGEMDVFPADQTSLTRQGMIPTMKKNLGQIGRGIKGFMTGTQEESIEEADDDITVFEKEHTREELDAMSDEALADLASTEYSAEDMLQYDEQGVLANRGEIIDVIMSYNADGEVDEGNQFSGALQKAKSTGQQEFDVDGKTYKVKEATPAPMADVALESLATMIRLAGLPKR